MNLIEACGRFIGKGTTDTGVSCIKLEIDVQGAKPVPVPVYIIPTRAVADTYLPDAFAPNSQILFSGRLYHLKNEGRMYVAPTTPLQMVNQGISLNHVMIAGGIGYIADEVREDLFSCGVMCTATPQKLLGFTWDDSVGFKLEAWGDDAVRMRKFLYKGRQLVASGSLRYDVWKDKSGQRAAGYKIRTKAGHYSFFGPNQPQEKKSEALQPVAAHTAAASPLVPDTDNIPF